MGQDARQQRTAAAHSGRLDAVLINPPTPRCLRNKEFIFPQSLLALAAYAQRAGFAVRLLDLNLALADDDEDEAAARARYLDIVTAFVARHQPLVAGIGCLFSGQFPFAEVAATAIKACRPQTVTCLGGIHPTIFTDEILTNCPAVDVVVIGEGEEQFAAVLAQARHPGGPLACDGIGFREHGRVVVRPKTGFIEDLDSLPLPAYGLLDFDAYRHDLRAWHNPKGHAFDLTVPLLTSRSCPNRCNFCSMFLVMGPRFRARSADNVLREIEWLHVERGVRHFTFMDDNLTFSKARTLAICEAIVRRGLDIQFDTPNGLMVRTLDREVVDALAAAGWVRGSIAIESGSDGIRNRVVGKGLSREKIFTVLGEIARHPQVFLRAYFIMGFPEETPQTLEDTRTMIEAMHIDDIYVNNLLPFPGTRLFAQCVRDGLLVGVDPDTIWRARDLYMNGNDTFFIKPYAMSIDDLTAHRRRFDVLLGRKRQEARQRRASLARPAVVASPGQRSAS